MSQPDTLQARVEKNVSEGAIAEFRQREQDTPRLAAKRRAALNALIRIRRTFTRPLKNADWAKLDEALTEFDNERKRRVEILRNLESQA